MNIDHLHYQVLGVTYPSLGTGTHIKVWRGDKQSGISWDELQAVKNEAIGEEYTAIEVFPSEHRVINEVNVRHLWVFVGFEKFDSFLYR